MTTVEPVYAGLGGIIPDWPAPSNVKAFITTRDMSCGVSMPPYNSFNLALHVDDSHDSVSVNRKQLYDAIGMNTRWLNQIHSTRLCEFSTETPFDGSWQADGVYSFDDNTVCAVQTADCLPLLFCSADGERIAAVHAGWRGLASGIIAEACAKMGASSELMVYMGPAISRKYYEVGEDVFEAFREAEATRCFYEPVECSIRMHPTIIGKYFLDIYGLARSELKGLGVHRIYGGNYCTYSDAERFYSYRRDGRTGRFASLIWRTGPE